MRILTVCTGNICRSPAAEILLADALGEFATVGSVGTHALVDHGVPEPMLAELARDGLDGSAHRARQMTEALLREADLVVAMTAAHRQRAVQMAPVTLKRSFTLAELAAAAGTGATLEGDSVADRLRDVPRAIAAHRHVLAGFELADVPDPYRRGQDAYRESYDLIRGAVAEIDAWINGTR